MSLLKGAWGCWERYRSCLCIKKIQNRRCWGSLFCRPFPQEYSQECRDKQTLYIQLDVCNICRFMSTPVISNNLQSSARSAYHNSFFLFKHLCESCTMDFDLTTTPLTTFHTIMKQYNEIPTQMSVNNLSPCVLLKTGKCNRKGSQSL